MINNVRKTVLSILNKNNYGYISPDDFNMFARQAQREVFENYFYQYAHANNKTNSRTAGSGYADIAAKHEQAIDTFHVTEALSYDAASTSYLAPSLLTTGSEPYLVMGMDILDTGVLKGEASKVSVAKARMLSRSNLTLPTYNNAIYSEDGGKITTQPNPAAAGDVECRYIRYPKDPNWTYLSFGNGEPLFDGTATDFQDFEVDLSEESELINKILQMAGLSIREIQMATIASQEEVERKTEQK